MIKLISQAIKNQQTEMQYQMKSLIDSTVNSTEEFLAEQQEYTKGQFFTPPSIAKFMAKLCDTKKNQTSIKILDPGAGTGTLLVHLGLELIKKGTIKRIHADLYENDLKLIDTLQKNIENLKREANKNDVQFTYNIFNQDFITHNSDTWRNISTLSKADAYDIVIANPPYFKLNKDDEISSLMSEIVHGQPNIYTLFMAMASKLLKDKGQLIFITPRSYCSGLYFKAFRKWFFEIMKPKHIHIFESRKKAFDGEILQELIILKAIKSKDAATSIDISSSLDANFEKNNTKLIQVQQDTIISDNDPELFLKIPTTEEDLQILDKMNNWSDTLLTLGFRLSTGPVIDFRSREFLRTKKEYNGKTTAPLFWMHNINGFTTKWPAPNGNKPASIKISTQSLNRLTINNNYVFLKRFTSKEQKRRIYAAVHHHTKYKTDYIGIENHLNYIWKTNKTKMTLSEAYGLMALFNSSFIDKYFRIVSGSTQVNATEINNMPLPEQDTIKKIGDIVKKQKSRDFNKIDNIINQFINKQSISKR